MEPEGAKTVLAQLTHPPPQLVCPSEESPYIYTRQNSGTAAAASTTTKGSTASLDTAKTTASTTARATTSLGTAKTTASTTARATTKGSAASLHSTGLSAASLMLLPLVGLLRW
ncbi:unnamed protein product [Lampetra fluviatilis]